MAVNKPTHIIVHHTGGTNRDRYASTQHHTVAIINEAHKARWRDFVSQLGYNVGYHYVIPENGKTEQTRYDIEEGAHCLGMNRSSIGVCITGNFTNGSPDMINEKQKQAFIKLVQSLMMRHGIPIENIVLHRDYASYKDCPGNRYTRQYFQNLVNKDEIIKELQELIRQQKSTIDILSWYIMNHLQQRTAKTLGAITHKSSFREL